MLMCVLDSFRDLELLIGFLQELDFFVVLLFLQLLLLVLSLLNGLTSRSLLVQLLL